MPSPSYEPDIDSVASFRFLLVNFDAEDLELYRPGGFHPVHLGDLYCDKRFRIVHKLGSGGVSTVWLARDEINETLVALKIAIAEASTMIESKSLLSLNAALSCASKADFVVQLESFVIDGPNGRHTCLVLPVLGPSASQLSDGFTSRLSPSLSRQAGYEATKALADLHAQGLCHGDTTTANIVFSLLDIQKHSEDDLYRLFGTPEFQTLETESGEPTGHEAPRYIVKPLDFLSSGVNHVSKHVRIIDFDQSFPVTAPPEKLLGTPTAFLAPEVAVGRPAGTASDVWALGCSIFHLMRVIIRAIGDIPESWGEVLFDYDGQPTTDRTKGQPLELYGESRPIINLVQGIWDRPQHDIVNTGTIREDQLPVNIGQLDPYPPCFSDMFWKPSAVRIDNVFLHGYDDGTEELLRAMPKISQDESTLLYDLLSKIFVYNPEDRISAAQMLDHPWFSMDGTLTDEDSVDSSSQ